MGLACAHSSRPAANKNILTERISNNLGGKKILREIWTFSWVVKTSKEVLVFFPWCLEGGRSADVRVFS
jgi:hypothetical protein